MVATIVWLSWTLYMYVYIFKYNSQSKESQNMADKQIKP